MARCEKCGARTGEGYRLCRHCEELRRIVKDMMERRDPAKAVLERRRKEGE